MMRYEVMYNASIEKMGHLVSERLENGWCVVGGLCVYRVYNNDVFAQAMTLSTNDKKPAYWHKITEERCKGRGMDLEAMTPELIADTMSLLKNNKKLITTLLKYFR